MKTLLKIKDIKEKVYCKKIKFTYDGYWLADGFIVANANELNKEAHEYLTYIEWMQTMGYRVNWNYHN